MNHLQDLLFAVLAGYFLGSIPFGLLVARSRGVDIRQHGSGNIGATNVLRVLGKKWGIPVFFLDAAKGVAAVWVAQRFFSAGPGVAVAGIAGAMACIVGHNFPVWLGFKGGKGIATSAGVLIGLLPWAALVAAAVWGVVFFTTRYVSVASIVAAVAIPLTVWLLEGRADALFWFSVVVAALAVWRHRSNIQRLLAGTENRFERKPKV